MKKGWQIKKLGELLEVQNGYAFSSKDYSQSGHFVMRIGNVQNGYVSLADPKFIQLSADGSLKRFVLSEGDILVSLTGNVGRVGVIQKEHLPSVLNQRVARISIRKGSPASRELLLLFLFSAWFREELTGAGHGAAQQNVSTNDLVEIQIPVPPLPEQQRIVGILDEAFDGIATAKDNAEKNLQNARALFESHLQSVFAQRGKGWVRTTIGDQVLLQRGFDITKDEQNEGGVPVVSSGGIKSFHDKAMVHAPGVVIGRKGTLGKVFYLEADFWPHDTTLWVRDFKGNDPRWVYYFFAGLDVKRLDSGTANPALNRNQVHPIEVDWPPISRQKFIVATLDALSEETQRLESLYQRKLDALEALKQSLLHQAFSGQL